MKEFVEKHMTNGKYFNAFWKCEDEECLCGKVHSPLDMFRKRKEEGTLLPVLGKSKILGEKFLSYEDTVGHPKRNMKVLPSNNFRIIEEPPFKLQRNYARCTHKCSNQACQKRRIIFKQEGPNKADVSAFKESLEDFAWTCGDSIDDTKLWITNPKLTCKDDIEAAYYSKLVDKGDHPLVCYHCGKDLNVECHQKNIESKDIHKTVKPTCTPDHCAKRPAKKWIERSKRKVDKKWIQKNWLKRKLTVIKRREEAERNAQNE